MSIRILVRDRIKEQRLVEVEPLVPVLSRSRSVLACAKAYEQLDPETAEDSLEAGRLRRKIDNLIRGDRIVVGQRRNRDCDVKRLDPISQEVWEVRERNSPSIRMFFRFAEKDCFVITNIRSVADLFSKIWDLKNLIGEVWPEWRAEIRLCKARWRALFITFNPHTGVSLHDYVSNSVDGGNI